MTITDQIRHLQPCREAREWAADYTDPAMAWAECQRGDWMLWLLGKLTTSLPWSDGRKPLLSCCLDCAETAKHLWPEKQREAIAAAVAMLRQWIAGEATVNDAKDARRQLSAAVAAAADAAVAAAVADAADAAVAAAAVAAAVAVADAADAAVAAAADAAAAVAVAVADAADAAVAAAAADAAAAAARRQAMARCADIVRLPQNFPNPPQITQEITQ